MRSIYSFREAEGGGVTRLVEAFRSEVGDIPGWVMIVLMTAALVVAVWGVARDKLIDIVSSALSTVCSGIGC